MRQVETPRTSEDVDDDVPELDPGAVTRNYRLARMRRRQRIERTMRSRHASIRFWAILVLLLALTAYVGIVIWQQIEKLFGL